MEHLFEVYSPSQIVIFIILLSMAIKELATFLDWFNQKIHMKVDKDNEPKELAKGLKDAIQRREAEIRELKHNDSQIKKSMDDIIGKINMLVASDRDSIKAWITSQHHHYIEKGSIDYYSLECIQKRYQHYKEEKGNSFIDSLMEELRKLPVQ